VTNEATLTPEQLELAVKAVSAIRAEVARAVVGQQEVIDQVLVALLAGGHVLIEGVPGLGKTLLVRALARTFDGHFARIQFTPDLMPSDVCGHAMYDPASHQFTTRRGPVFANLVLADEINRAPAKTQAALLEVMQEGQVTIEGAALPLTPPFMVLATQNPIEHEGTYALPEAQLDRFLFKVLIGYPEADHERALVRQTTAHQAGDRLNVDNVQTVVKAATIVSLQQAAARLTVDDAVVDYAVRIVRATRSWDGITSGAGPRGSIALIRAARGAALLAGRGYVVPDDIKRMALPALRHRLALSPELEIEGHTAEALIPALLEQVEAPRR